VRALVENVGNPDPPPQGTRRPRGSALRICDKADQRLACPADDDILASSGALDELGEIGLRLVHVDDNPKLILVQS